MKNNMTIIFVMLCILFSIKLSAQCCKADAGTNKFICCPGGSVSLSGTDSMGCRGCDTLLIQWSPTTGLSNSHILNPIASPGSTTTYTLCIYAYSTTMHDTCCVSCDSVTVTVTSKCCRLAHPGSTVPAVLVVKVVPNPSAGKFNVTLNRPIENGGVQVYDLSGRMVWEKKNINGDEEIQPDMTGKEKGIYLLKVSENSQVVHTERIILE